MHIIETKKSEAEKLIQNYLYQNSYGKLQC